MNLNSLVIEVTRRCNIRCDHCLRGDAQGLNINLDYIDSLLSQVDYISDVTFTGGEPSLNVEALNKFLELAKQYNVNIGDFYIATNGIDISEDFVIFLLKMYRYCDEKETCVVNVSNDMYHLYEGGCNLGILEGLSFVSKKYEDDNFDYSQGKNLIKQGFSEDHYNGREKTSETIESLEDFEDADLYLNCNGDIVIGCDWSYKNQDDHILCKVEDLYETYTKLEEDE